MAGDTERLRVSLHLLIGFFGGCVVAAAAVSLLRDWAWSFPVAMAGVAVMLRQGTMDRTITGEENVCIRTADTYGFLFYCGAVFVFFTFFGPFPDCARMNRSPALTVTNGSGSARPPLQGLGCGERTRLQSAV